MDQIMKRNAHEVLAVSYKPIPVGKIKFNDHISKPKGPKEPMTFND